MCGNLFSSPSRPSPPPIPSVSPAHRQPRLADEGVRKARSDIQNRARAAVAGGTLLTGPGGLTTTANTQKKTLLGA